MAAVEQPATSRKGTKRRRDPAGIRGKWRGFLALGKHGLNGVLGGGAAFVAR